MAGEEKKDEQPAASPLGKAADRVRESAKWLIASFAAVGALLIAGLQIADIGALSGGRLAGAIVGIILGVLGVVVAIAAASSVVTKSFVTLKGLAEQTNTTKEPLKSIEGDKVMLGGLDSVSALKNTYEAAATARLQALKTYYESPTDDNKLKAETASNWAKALDRIESNVLDRASFIVVKEQYGLARWGILIGAALSAIGIATFAYAANPPESAPLAAVVEKTPTEVTVMIRKPNQALSTKLGPSCDLAAVKAVAVADMGANYQVASIPTTKCKAALFVVTPAIGRIGFAKPDDAAASSSTNEGP